MVSDLPVYRRNATSVTVWIQKKGEFVSRESGTEKKLRNWLMVSNIPFGSYQPKWKDYLKTCTPQFSVGISEKWPFHFPSISEIFRQMVSTQVLYQIWDFSIRLAGRESNDRGKWKESLISA